ncbi:MAG: hypothetical protein NTX03_06515 [Bacteroidetes bacterium]|nr:hypothetical protein [Bacteroidota bacterium]
MKKILFYILFSFSTIILTSCSDYLDYSNYTGSGTNSTDNFPSSYRGRPVSDAGTTHLTGKTVTFKVWDSGQVDGDIITLVVNGTEVISNYTLTADKKSVTVTLKKQYNYVLLYAHNVGSISPNTCAVIMNDGSGDKTITLSSDLTTSQAMHLYVD